MKKTMLLKMAFCCILFFTNNAFAASKVALIIGNGQPIDTKELTAKLQKISKENQDIQDDAPFITHRHVVKYQDQQIKPKDTDAILMKRGVWRDPKTKLVWMRCSLGQTWNGKTCMGEAMAYTWDEAIKAAKVLNKKGGFAGYVNWQVPHIEDLMTIHQCKAGFEDTIQIPKKAGGTKKVGEYCKESKQKYTAFNSAIFPNMQKDWYWAFPILSDGEGFLAYFGNGLDESYERHYNYVRLVRVNQ